MSLFCRKHSRDSDNCIQYSAVCTNFFHVKLVTYDYILYIVYMASVKYCRLYWRRFFVEVRRLRLLTTVSI